MAEVKISELPVGGKMEIGDLVPVVRGGVTVQCDRQAQIATITPLTDRMEVDASDPENLLMRLKRTIAIMFNEPGNLTAGEEMRMGNTEGQNNQGWVAPFDGTLTTMTISRGDSDAAEIDVSINGVIQATVNTSSLKSVETISVAVNATDSIMVLGGATTPNAMTQPVVVLLLEES